MLNENQHPHNRSIVLSVLGVPNAGKSSLINCFLGVDLSIVSRLPQTTRNRFNCVFSVDRTEVVMIDTPGLHRSGNEFNVRLNDQAKEAIDGVDINLLLIDLTRPLAAQLELVTKTLDKALTKTWVVFTKSDIIKDVESLPIEEMLKMVQTFVPAAERSFVISSKKEDRTEELLGAILDEAKESPHLYPNGDISNKNMRFFAAEYIREQAFFLLKDELPYEVAVTIDSYKDVIGSTGQHASSKVAATILVNRPSQRAIVIGKQGSVIKQIGTAAREKLSKLMGVPVHLNLHVKVSPKWQKNHFIMEEIGLPRTQNSRRVWRAK
jgi:GTP-binding protein Era